MKNPTTHPLHQTWYMMKYRCYNPTHHNYKSYGGRGIQVAQEWIDDFDMFVYHMGEKPSPEHTLDRVDNDYHYCPENCRWATKKEQQANVSRANYKSARGCYRNSSGTFTAKIKLGGQNVFIGTYKTEEEATAKYQEVKHAFFGHLHNH